MRLVGGNPRARGDTARAALTATVDGRLLHEKPWIRERSVRNPGSLTDRWAARHLPRCRPEVCKWMAHRCCLSEALWAW